MESRFTIKDLFLAVLMVAVVLVVVLAMFQYDRQWDTLKLVERRLAELNGISAEQGKELSAIRRLLEQGIRVSGTATTAPAVAGSDAAAPAGTDAPAAGAFATPKGDPFARQTTAMASPDYARGDWLVQLFGVKVGKLTPLLSTDTYASIVQNRILESLAYRDPDTLEWLPLLATDWDVSPDGQKINVKLRRGVLFSDGSPFTADDVVFTVDFIRNEAIGAPRQRSALEPLDRVEKVGDHEVVFHFKRPYFEALALALSTQPMSKRFYERFLADPQRFNDSVGLVMGTGPYRMADPEGWRPGQPIELFRNERYWGLPAPFDRIFWREVEEDAAALTMFRNGEVDTYAATPPQFDQLKDDPSIAAKANRFQYYFRDGGYSYVAWNQRRAGKPTLFADKRVRQAMTLLIDRERIARDVYRGYAKPAVGPFGVVSPQNDPSIQPWPYDPKRAVELLREAGFAKRNDRGVLVHDDGREFRFRFTYNNKNPQTEQIVLQIKDSLARAGIVVEQEPTDWPLMLKKLNERDYDVITLGWTGGVETDIYQMFHSSQIQDGADNFMSYSNPDLDAAIERARATVDEGQRMPVWHQAHRILHEDQPYTFVVIGQALQFVDNRIRNVEQTKSGLNYFGQDVMPIPWYVPAGRQRHTD